MEITLSLLLIPYLIFLIFFLLFSFFNIYHLFRYAPVNLVVSCVVTTYILTSGLIILISVISLMTVDWQQNVSFTPIGSLVPPPAIKQTYEENEILYPQ
jgi:hypothetical protein